MSTLVLVNSKTGAPVTVGAKITSFRGDQYWLRGASAPRHAGSTGHLYVTETKRMPESSARSFYPSVFGLEFRSFDRAPERGEFTFAQA